MKFNNYMKLVNAFRYSYPEWRVGQTFFNVLLECDPDLAERIRGTEDDPFYRNEKLPEFLGIVAEEWDK